MKTMLELNEKKVPAIWVDNSLNKYEKEVLFPKKLAKANAALENTNLQEVLRKKGGG